MLAVEVSGMRMRRTRGKRMKAVSSSFCCGQDDFDDDDDDDDDDDAALLPSSRFTLSPHLPPTASSTRRENVAVFVGRSHPTSSYYPHSIDVFLLLFL